MRPITAILILASQLVSTLATAQNAKNTHNVNLRLDEYPPIRPFETSEPLLTVLDPNPESGNCRVKTTKGETKYVCRRNVTIVISENGSAEAGCLGTPVPRSASMVGCGDGLWQHVHHATRLMVSEECITGTGPVVGVSAWHKSDGVRHEADGDTRGWLAFDPRFQSLIDPANMDNTDGTLVVELLCHNNGTQDNVKSTCAGFHHATIVPPVGTHVASKATLATENNHVEESDIQPVSSIRTQ